MPAAKVLFHKAIVESGSQLRGTPAETATAAAQRFRAHVELSLNEVDQLQQMSIQQLLTATHELTTDVNAGPNSGLPLGPVVDGRSLPRHPFDPTAPEFQLVSRC